MNSITTSRKVASININAISSALKKGLLKDFVWNNDIDLVFLQEVAFENFGFISSHVCLVNISDDNKGTAVLIRRCIDFENVLMNPNGRILSVVVGKVNFVNVYAHSGSQYKNQRDVLFSHDIIPHLSSIYPNVILGDFNCILLNQDSNGSVKNKCKGLGDLTSNLNLFDIGRSVNGKTIYTFYRGESMSRIDRVYGPEVFLENVLSFDTIATAFSDHYALLLKFKIDSKFDVTSTGKGFWKINPSILLDEDIQREFIKEIENTKQRFAYCSDFYYWWENHFKPKVKSFYKSKSYERNNLITSSKSFLYGCLREISEKQNNGEDVSKEFSFVKSKLMNIEQNRLNNLKLKLNDSTVVEDEKLSVFQLSKVLKRNSPSNSMKLMINGQVTSEKHKIQSALEQHFDALLGGDNTFHPGVDSLFQHVKNRLSQEQSNNLIRPVELNELEHALKQATKKKSPGPDGLTYEFYTIFFDYLKDDLLKLFNLLLAGLIPKHAFVEGIITLIPKKEKSFEISDQRPISMLNCDYKLFTKILMNRLQPILDSLIGPGQSACISEKSCITNLKFLRNICIKANQSSTFKALIASFDLEKAFDRVDHHFLWLCLEKFGFPVQFVNCIRNLYKNASSRILFNGFLTNSIRVRSSVRQGCPLSMALFILYIEPLIRMLYESVRGCLVDNSFIRVIAYADDINVFVRNNNEFDTILELINYFSIYAKIRLNIGKSHYMRLNNCLSGPHLLREVSSLKILGVNFYQNYNLTIENNYSSIISSMKFLISLHIKRRLNIIQKTWILNSIILSKLWYLAQIYPPSNSNIAEIRTLCRNFIFKGIGLYRVRFDQLYLDVDKGGLSLIDVECKAKSLFIKNVLFVHQDGDKDSFMLSQQNNRSLGRNSLEWIRESSEISKYPGLTTSKSIYRFLISQHGITPKIEQEFPDLPWNMFWQNLHKNFLSSEVKHSLYILFNDLIPTKSKLFRHKVRGTVDNTCESCFKVDTSKHRIKLCLSSRKVWAWIKETIVQKLKIAIEDPEEMFGKDIEDKHLQSKVALWLTAEGVHYNLIAYGEGSLEEFVNLVREKRWNNRTMFKKVFGKWITAV